MINVFFIANQYGNLSILQSNLYIMHFDDNWFYRSNKKVPIMRKFGI